MKKEDEYNRELFNINNYLNYAPLNGHRSKGSKCARCSASGSEDKELAYHAPTGLDFCFECVWNIEKLTLREDKL